MTRKKLTVAARGVLPGDYVELEETSSGIPLPDQMLVLATHEDLRYDEHEEAELRIWLQLDPSKIAGTYGLKSNSSIGTFLEPDTEVVVYRDE